MGRSGANPGNDQGTGLTMTAMAKHSAPSLRLAEVPDRITVLADAMRAFADRPGSPDARRELDMAMRGCTDEEYEVAWDMAQRETGARARSYPGPPPGVRMLPLARQSRPLAVAPGPAAAAVTPARRAAGSLTLGQRILAGFAATLGLGLAPMFFIVMFMTVNELLGPYFSGWAWTVPVATETTFVLLTVLAILFEWTRRPVPSLWKLPYLFAALSLFMNVWAYRDSPAGIAGHLAVTAAFFIPMGFAKTTVRKLIVTSAERARAASLADARAHAYDVLRAAFGVLWRYRTPVLLRRQLKSGRLPAAVAAAVETCDAATWEPVVQAWITAAVTLPSQVGKALRAASVAAAATPSEGAGGTPEEAPGTPLAGTSEPPSKEAAEPLPAAHPNPSPALAAHRPGRGPRTLRGVPANSSDGSRGRGSGEAAIVPSKASDRDLADLLVPLLAKGEEVSQTRTVKIIREAAGGSTGIGPERAGRVLGLARRIHAGEASPDEGSQSA